jgi:urease accessory protein
MSWRAELHLHYLSRAGRSVAMHRHSGPLRVLQSLYPEGDAVCHNVMVHPPGGVVGGDELHIDVRVDAGAHGLVTTPGATRFYRTTGPDGPAGRQQVSLRLAAEARLEWLPLENIFHSGCIAENHLHLSLAAGAELIGWDVAAFGLPLAAQPFDSGRVTQHIEAGDFWLEHARIDAQDRRLLDGALGLAGHRCLGSLFLVTGTPLTRERREAALESARVALERAGVSGAVHGATSPQARVVVVRVLAPVVEPAMQLLQAVRDAWRAELWRLPALRPRIWAA